MVGAKKVIIPLFLIVCSVIYSYDLKVTVFDNDINIFLEGVKIINPASGDIGYTDSSGVTFIKKEETEQFIIIADLVGYQSRRILVKRSDSEIRVGLSMGFILEGKELVIEGRIPGVSDEKVGVSKVVEKEELKTTAMSGPMPDVMSTVKTLPGVIYAGKFSPNFSVRGGEPQDLTTVMDGFIVQNPWHWGGGFSIFNPNIVESLKFSAGIFSAKYGPAASGLMEVNTINPNDGLKVFVSLSIMSAEVLIQTPFINEKSGVYAGGRLTSQDLPILMIRPILDDQGISFTRAPYIYDGYFKWFVKPNDRVEWYINSFFGFDGIGMIAKGDGAEQAKDIKGTFTFNWENTNIFASTGFKLLPHDRVFIHILGGYGYVQYDVDGKTEEKGNKKYSAKFIELYEEISDNSPVPLPELDERFYIDSTGFWHSSDRNHSAQGRVDVDVTLTDRVLFSFGGGTVFNHKVFKNYGEIWNVNFETGLPVYEKMKFDIKSEARRYFQSFTYLTFDINVIPEVFQIEAGARADHFIFLGDDYTINTYPVPGPRLNFFLSPFKSNDAFESLTMSLGVGLFSKIPAEVDAYEKTMGVKDFELSIGKTLTAVSGVEVLFPFGIKFKTEGYFKYMFDRFYLNLTRDNEGISRFIVHSDGYGYSSGFDISVERKMSRYLDGSLSYSFNYSRMFNPQTNGGDSTYNGKPTGQWYYPSYHRFHSMNFILNARPADFITITSKWTVASGSPYREASDTHMFFAVDQKTGSVLELYAVDYKYSDSLRTEISIPFDLKVSFNFFIPGTKIYMEVYAGVEDLFAPLYSPKGGKQVDMFTGGERVVNDGMAINAPLPSFGFSMSF